MIGQFVMSPLEAIEWAEKNKGKEGFEGQEAIFFLSMHKSFAEKIVMQEPTEMMKMMLKETESKYKTNN